MSGNKVFYNYEMSSTLIEAKEVFEDFDVFVSFRSSFRATIIKFCISSKNKYQFSKKKYKKVNQV